MQIIFVLKNGEEKIVNFSENQTILKVAEENNIFINGACEGFGVCGRCHVIIENLQDKLPKISNIEEDTLDKAKRVTMQSRLACQIVLNKSLDGIKIKLV